MKRISDSIRRTVRRRLPIAGLSLTAIMVAITLTLAFTSVALAKGNSLESQIAKVRAATARFHNVATAQAAGYAPFLGCIDQPGQGAMGFHYVNGDLVSAPILDPLRPQALLYAPDDGTLELTGVEYVIFAADWKNAGHSQPPSLFGRTFEFTDSPNRYGLPPFYSLHAWVWKHNPSGMFSDWNPDVSCTGDR